MIFLFVDVYCFHSCSLCVTVINIAISKHRTCHPQKMWQNWQKLPQRRAALHSNFSCNYRGEVLGKFQACRDRYVLTYVLHKYHMNSRNINIGLFYNPLPSIRQLEKLLLFSLLLIFLEIMFNFRISLHNYQHSRIAACNLIQASNIFVYETCLS